MTIQTFNDFFIRELKQGARPIAMMERNDIAVCAADCRLVAFKSQEDAKRFWIKVDLIIFFKYIFTITN